MNKKIYLYRHGETNWNLLSRVMGQLENITTTFTPTGIKEINEISEDLKKNSIEVIYCSDVPRAYETALIAAGRNNIPIIKTKALRGLNMGKHQGKLFEEYINNSDVKTALSNYSIPIGGGESINDLNKRIYNFILNLCQKTEYKNIGIITHSAVISNLKSYLTKEKYCSLNRCNLEYNDMLKVSGYKLSEQSKIKLNNELIFVRHGENIYDENPSNDELILSKLGVEQANNVSKLLNNNFDVIISSPSKRCIVTASIISDFNKKIILDERLYERGWGNNKKGYETDFEAKERFLDFLIDVNLKYSDRKILVITHGSLMKLIQDVIEQNNIDRENIDNCTVIKYNKEKRKTLIR